MRFSTHTSGRPRSRTSSSESRPVRGSAPRRSTTDTGGQPARSTALGGGTRPWRATCTAVGHGETRRHGTPSRRARSASTSAAS